MKNQLSVLKMFKSKYTLIIGIIVAISLFSLRQPSLDLGNHLGKDEPDFVFNGVTLSLMEMGIPKWIIRSNEAEIDKETSQAKLDNMIAEVFENDEKTLDIMAPKARLNMETSNVQLTDGEAMFYLSEREVIVKAADMVWLSESRQLIGKKDVEIHNGDLLIKTQHIQLEVPVTEIRLNRGGSIIITPKS